MELYKRLANAIVLQAVRDWKSARRRLNRRPQNEIAWAELENCERFFRSDYFGLMAGIDGNVLLENLYEEDGR